MLASYRRIRGEAKPEFLRLPDAMKVFGMGEEKIRNLSKECDAMVKIDKCILIDYEKLRRYIETFRVYDHGI